MWVLIAIVVIVLLAYLLYAYGVFSPMTLYQETLQNTTLLYFSWKGSKEELGTPFSEVEKAKQDYFKLSNHFGIYYSLPDKEVWDCVVGIVVNAGERNKIDGFLAENPNFKKKHINSVPYIGAEMPYVNRLSYYLLSLKIPKFVTNL